MTDTGIRELVKDDLGELNDDKDALIDQMISEAKEYIETEGVTLNMESNGDVGLVRMYAAWLFRKRASDKGDGLGNIGKMPRMLRWSLNNRVMKEHAQAEG